LASASFRGRGKKKEWSFLGRGVKDAVERPPAIIHRMEKIYNREEKKGVSDQRKEEPSRKNTSRGVADVKVAGNSTGSTREKRVNSKRRSTT